MGVTLEPAQVRGSWRHNTDPWVKHSSTNGVSAGYMAPSDTVLYRWYVLLHVGRDTECEGLSQGAMTWLAPNYAKRWCYLHLITSGESLIPFNVWCDVECDVVWRSQCDVTSADSVQRKVALKFVLVGNIILERIVQLFKTPTHQGEQCVLLMTLRELRWRS